MKTEGGAPSNEPSGAVKGESKPQICSICGIQLSSKDQFCPVRVLRKVLDEKVESGESFSEHSVKPRSELVVLNNYELAKSDDGTPV
jgi:protein kinase-like protein